MSLSRSNRTTSSPETSLVEARTCYDHLAGRLGVALMEALVARAAILGPATSQGLIALGPTGPEVLGRLGIDPGSLRRGRRRFATVCVDWTEGRPHLAGALGAALLVRLQALGWVEKQDGTRAVALTEAGRRGLEELLALRLEDAAP